MARHYGVKVKAFNVSREQLAFARERAVREGLADRVEFVDDDYRNVTGTFDAFVSIGMLEHVGLPHLHTFAGAAPQRVRRDGGRGLLHFIGRDAPRPLNPWIRRRIFPGAYTPDAGGSHRRASSRRRACRSSTSRTCACTTRGRSTLGRRASRRRTTRCARRMATSSRRAWELYLAGSQAAFATGWMQLFQVVFAPRETAAAVLGARRGLLASGRRRR